MPVNPEFVPLATAKTWAKRLQRTSKTQTPDAPWPLTRCQLAVAQMLGFEHWHALSKALTVAIDPKQSPKSMPARPVIAQLPSNPQGWDAVIELQDQTPADYTLADMSLPEQVSAQLTSVVKRTRNGAGMVFCGGRGTGKTRLMQAVVNQFTHEHAPVKGHVLGDPPEFLIPHMKSIPVVRREPEDRNENNPGGAWQRATHSAMRGDPDVLVIGEVRDEHSAKAMFQAMDSGIATFTTLHSTSGGVIERLKVFDDRGNWAQRLAGWAHTRLLGLLCPECSIHCGKPGRERKKGHGCSHCGFVGLTGRQLVVDVWEMNNGTPTQVSCMLSQARELVKQGLVDRDSAIDALGPLEGPKAR